MECCYYTADVFTNEPFSGAQIAVFPDATNLNPKTMQQIAGELNLSETVFLSHHKQNPSNLHKRMRTFTPTQELDFAGHPIIAAACVLAKTGAIPITETDTAIILEQNIGPIKAYIMHKNGNALFFQFSLSCTASVDSFVPGDQELSEILSFKNAACISNPHYQSKLITTENSYLIIPCNDLEQLQNARFDATAWGRSSAPSTNAGHLLLFSKSTYSNNADFHLRLLGPNVGNEDPPVGSALTAFSSYLASFQNLRKGTYTYAAERGSPKTRISLLHVEMDNKENDTLTLRIGGPAVLMSKSTLYL